mgnify:CR=1 FL=1
MTTKNILIIKSSPALEQSVSNEMADFFMAQFASKEADYTFTIRDLAKTPAPVYSPEILNAFYTPLDQLSDEQARLVAPSLTYIEEIKSADLIVIASPMHNFSVTSLLKNYIDQICRMGLTFKYSEAGPEGLLKDKQALIISTAGGDFISEASRHKDFQAPYLNHVLNFIGINDVKRIAVHKLGLGDEVAAQVKAEAKQALTQFATSY